MKKLIFVGKWHIIEPLGILYLLGLAKQLRWNCRVVLVDEFDFEPLYREVKMFRPDLVCFSIWTGWHTQTFVACDWVRSRKIPVVIGGPHATYSTEQCVPHADMVIKGDGFRNFRLLLQGKPLIGKLKEFPNVYFDPERVTERFPKPDRELVYETYPVLRSSPIKSIMCTVGCPFHCSYCYAPSYNRMYGGFELNLRTVDDIIQEGLALKHRWPARLIYFQDDIFGYRLEWLREFSRRWKQEVGIPWHCQIRLELTEGEIGKERLNLFCEGGCTGITLAIESGNAFLRQFVLERPMEHRLIVEGCRKIQKMGLTLRTEQILAIPFSDIQTDLGTLALNCEINPEMAWTSILAPYGGTVMGTIASNFGFYTGNNDDLTESFFDRSVLQHADRGREVIEPHVRSAMTCSRENPLVRMRAMPKDSLTADVYLCQPENSILNPTSLMCELRYLDERANARYCEQTVALQRLFNWLSKVPQGAKLAERWVVDFQKQDWTWKSLARLTNDHLNLRGFGQRRVEWRRSFAQRLNYYSPNDLPSGIRDFPEYFCFLPSGPEFAQKLHKEGFFMMTDPSAQFDVLGKETRHWLFNQSLYKISPAEHPIASDG